MRLLCLLLCGLLSGLAQGQEAAELRVIQVRADLPNLTIWANLPNDTPSEAGQISVSVGERPATVTRIDHFRQTGQGVAYIFLVDISKSLNPRQFAQIQRALHQWVDGMSDDDRAALMTFGGEVKQTVDFTADHDRLNAAVEALAPTDMETSLYQGLSEAINLGRRQDAELPNRRAIVMLSDGIDDSTAGMSVEDVFRQSREYRVPIYSIGFASDPVNERKREGLKVLGLLARQSGGYFVQANAANLDEAYQRQQQRIIQAYRIGVDCAACEANGQLHHINVTWSDGRSTLSDGLELRLLPKAAPDKALFPEKMAGNQDQAILVFAGGLLLFFAALIWIYRQRLVRPPADEPQPLHEPKKSSAQSQKIENRLAVRLTTVAGLQKGKSHQLDITERALLGRAGNCDLTLEDDVEISGQHALLLRTAGKLIIRDLNSTNGTLVNGVPIHNDYPLRNGDLLLLGRTELRIEFADS